MKDNILTRQVACVSAAKERSESTKLFRRAKTARRNQAALAKRLILGCMTRPLMLQIGGSRVADPFRSAPVADR